MRDIRDILNKVDHTLLSICATEKEIFALCDAAIRQKTASVCIPPSYVKSAKEYVGDRMQICTVIGFPNGYSTTAAKVAETADAVASGADEIDMVINLGWVKDKKDDLLLSEIRAIRAAAEGKILKVIIETCLLTTDEKIRMCRIVSAAGADYIKTSTGFSSGGATVEDVCLLRKNTDVSVRVKAAGGISTLWDAEALLSAGADRLGTSRIVKLVENGQSDGQY